jgi:hypothetical protein
LPLCLSKYNVMKTYWGLEVQLHASLHLALDVGRWLASCPSRFTSREKVPGTYWVGGWVGYTASLDTVQKKNLLPLSRNESQLNYPGSDKIW